MHVGPRTLVLAAWSAQKNKGLHVLKVALRFVKQNSVPLNFNPAIPITNGQAMTGWLPCDHGMLQIVNGVPYYVTVSTVGNASTGFVVVQKYVGGVWSAAVSSSFQTTDIAVCHVGTTIYILHEDVSGNKPLLISRYSTVTDLFLTDGAGGPVNAAGSDYMSINPFLDGKMLATNVNATNDVVAAVYDPVANTWAGPVTIRTSPPAGFSKFVFGVCVQSSTAMAFIFYGTFTTATGMMNMCCKSCTEALVLGKLRYIVLTAKKP